MKATELRIGNIVNISEYWYSRNPHLSKTPKQIIVDSIDYDGLIGTSIYFANGYEIENDLDPIPLTEEWLLMFGFKKLTDSRDGFKITSYTYTKGVSFIVHFDGIRLSTNFWIGNEKQYVHQLQNLYFALTGEELTLKD